MAKKRKTTGKKSGGQSQGVSSMYWERPGDVAGLNPLRQDQTETVMPEHRRPHEERAAEVAKDAGLAPEDE